MSKLIRFFVPKNSELWRVPRSQFQQDNASSQYADTHEMILIRQMYARNTVEAKRLMEKYSATTALEVITAINRQKPTVRERLWRNFKKLVRRIEGSSSHNVQLKPLSKEWRLPK